jgi:hypothetical protein
MWLLPPKSIPVEDAWCRSPEAGDVHNAPSSHNATSHARKR